MRFTNPSLVVLYVFLFWWTDVGQIKVCFVCVLILVDRRFCQIKACHPDILNVQPCQNSDSGVQHEMKKKWTQSDVSLCKNEGSKRSNNNENVGQLDQNSREICFQNDQMIYFAEKLDQNLGSIISGN